MLAFGHVDGNELIWHLFLKETYTNTLDTAVEMGGPYIFTGVAISFRLDWVLTPFFLV